MHNISLSLSYTHRSYPGPRGFLSPRREYQATDKEVYFLSLRHFALRLSPFHGSSLRKPLASRVHRSTSSQEKMLGKFLEETRTYFPPFILFNRELISENVGLAQGLSSQHFSIRATTCLFVVVSRGSSGLKGGFVRLFILSITSAKKQH